MTPKLTEEMRQALREQPGTPLEIEDDETRTSYVIVAKETFVQMVDEELRRQLQIGIDQADAGQVSGWDVNEVLAEAHRRHAIC
ncbi:MAG: hypothetical protein WD648_10585 [Planctomycetaceae bacterium]